ncbi:DoxX family protein [Tunicatimonas pelagia]|uniref:DoxX family protein n=1 Tax=Tunicatimonas pelagia TaxID=931531 RepID=UPI0026670511|nr:DoxX family protein [Tunicatimonas pelagia]WKN46246.1 DoxX family protein [Tunicatimonas pelagia]
MLRTSTSSTNNVHLGLLILRLGMGVSFIAHGVPKLMDGPERWEQLGGTMANLGITFLPTIWGFMGSFAECVGGLCLVLGILWVPALLLLTFTMIVATAMHISNGDSYSGISHPLEAGIVFIGLLVTGPGKHRVSKKL